MNGFAVPELANMRQQELMMEATHSRLVKEARLAARGAPVPTRRPLIWLREAAHGFASRLAHLKAAQASGH